MCGCRRSVNLAFSKFKWIVDSCRCICGTSSMTKSKLPLVIVSENVYPLVRNTQVLYSNCFTFCVVIMHYCIELFLSLCIPWGCGNASDWLPSRRLMVRVPVDNYFTDPWIPLKAVLISKSPLSYLNNTIFSDTHETGSSTKSGDSGLEIDNIIYKPSQLKSLICCAQSSGPLPFWHLWTCV